jgi:hypothetical protein
MFGSLAVALTVVVARMTLGAASARAPSPRVVQSCGGYTATIVGTNGDNVLNGTPNADVIVGLGGYEVIRAAVLATPSAVVTALTTSSQETVRIRSGVATAMIQSMA